MWFLTHRFKSLRLNEIPTQEIQMALENGASWAHLVLWMSLKNLTIHPQALASCVRRRLQTVYLSSCNMFLHTHSI